ncbi:MAG: SIMPL domain-containing protein, partial [Candidatus Eisenbacteria bacterium]
MNRSHVSMVCLLVATALSVPPDIVHAQRAADGTPRSITVLGEAEVRVVPDEVVLTLGVETMNLELAAAKQENDRLVSAVIAAAVEVGVPAQRVQTDHVQIEPRYEEQRTRRDFVGYFVRK